MPTLSTYKPFPFCQSNVEVAAVVNPSFFPVKISLATLFKWFYRVKKWRIAYNVSFNNTIPGGTAVGQYEGYDIVGGGAASEKDMVCNLFGDLNAYYSSIHTPHTVTVEIPPSAPVTSPCNGTTSLQFAVPEFTYGGGGPTIDPDYGIETDFLRWLRVTGQTEFEDDYIIELILTALGTEAEPISTTHVLNGITSYAYDASGVVATMDGIALPVFNVYVGNTISQVSTGTITITPEEYWPHDPDDGDGPVFNTTTGATLRDPKLVKIIP